MAPVITEDVPSDCSHRGHLIYHVSRKHKWTKRPLDYIPRQRGPISWVRFRTVPDTRFPRFPSSPHEAEFASLRTPKVTAKALLRRTARRRAHKFDLAVVLSSEGTTSSPGFVEVEHLRGLRGLRDAGTRRDAKRVSQRSI